MAHQTALDTVITVVLFVALLPAVPAAVFVGLHMLMLGDALTDKGSPWGVWVAVVGIPVSAVVVYVAAAVLAWTTHGYRFYIPIAALLVGSLLAVGLSALAYRIVRGA